MFPPLRGCRRSAVPSHPEDAARRGGHLRPATETTRGRPAPVAASGEAAARVAAASAPASIYAMLRHSKQARARGSRTWQQCDGGDTRGRHHPARPPIRSATTIAASPPAPYRGGDRISAVTLSRRGPHLRRHRVAEGTASPPAPCRRRHRVGAASYRRRLCVGTASASAPPRRRSGGRERCEATADPL